MWQDPNKNGGVINVGGMDVVMNYGSSAQTISYTVGKKTANWFIVRSMSKAYANSTSGTCVRINGTIVPVGNMASTVSGIYGCSIHKGDYELNVGDVVEVITANASSIRSAFFCESAGSSDSNIVPTQCWYVSTRTVNAITRAFLTPVDYVIVMVDNSSAFDNVASSKQGVTKVFRGESVAVGGCIISLSSDGLTLSKGAGTAGYFAFIGISGGNESVKNSVIPFTIAAVSGRSTVNSQNCYLWNDSGVPKEHLEFNITITSALSANTGFADGFIPFNSMNYTIQGVLPNNLYFQTKSAGTASNIASTAALSKNTVLDINVDVPLDYSHS